MFALMSLLLLLFLDSVLLAPSVSRVVFRRSALNLRCSEVELVIQVFVFKARDVHVVILRRHTVFECLGDRPCEDVLLPALLRVRVGDGLSDVERRRRELLLDILLLLDLLVAHLRLFRLALLEIRHLLRELRVGVHRANLGGALRRVLPERVIKGGLRRGEHFEDRLGAKVATLGDLPEPRQERTRAEGEDQERNALDRPREHPREAVPGRRLAEQRHRNHRDRRGRHHGRDALRDARVALLDRVETALSARRG
mmetsp:Transcript_19905/g.64802  ORF Transcript_19905/g.64802 Transcript_19905/m.64802 type:complete len:255 (-) Transcript_19905:108-872(-)